MQVTDAMIDAGCSTRHSPRTWKRATRDPQMTAWVTSHREIMRRILTAAIEASADDPAEVWEQYLHETSAEGRSEQGALAFGFWRGEKF